MSPAAKIVIALAAIFVVMGLATIGVGVMLWSRYSDELLEAGRKNIEQGIAFGRETDEAGCLDEAITRYKAHRGMTGSLATGFFEQGCLRASRPTAGFCTQVPLPTDILRAGRWQMEQSKRAGIYDQFSGQIFAQVQAYCASKRR